MKKILLFFAAAACAIASWAQTDATVSATVKSQTLEVALTNESEDFVAFQMDITLPSGVNVANENAVTLSLDRLTQNAEIPFAGAANSNFEIAYNVINSTTVRVIAYNLKNRAIEGTAGTLFTMAFSGETSENFTISNVKFVTLSALEEIELAIATSTPGASHKRGDVDMNGEVDTLDLSLLIDIILEKVAPTATSNVDESGDVDTLDLSLLVDIILEKV